MRTNVRKAAVAAFGVAATVLAVGSVAYACTDIQGKMVLTTGATQSTTVGTEGSHAYCSVTGGAQGASGASITLTVSAYTNGGDADTCPSTRLAASADAPGAGWVRDPECFSPLDGTTALPVCSQTGKYYYTMQGKGYGDYEVRFQAGGTFNRSGSTYTHEPFVSSACIDGDPSDYVVLPGAMTVAADGSGSWTGNLPTAVTASAPTDAGAICIHAYRNPEEPPNDVLVNLYGGSYGDQTTAQTNQAPIILL